MFTFIFQLDAELVTGALADVFRKLSVLAAQELEHELEQLESDSAMNGNASNGSIKPSPDEIDNIKKDSLYSRLKHYVPEQVPDPSQAVKLRDPLGVTKKFPLPEGAFFVPPAAEDGSEPYRIPPPGTNAFDCSHIEAQKLQQQLKLVEDPTMTPVQSHPQVTSANLDQTHAYTPRGYNGVDANGHYDPYMYLQGAQKVLENLSVTQQPQQLAPAVVAATHSQSTTPGGILPSTTPTGGANTEDKAHQDNHEEANK